MPVSAFSIRDRWFFSRNSAMKVFGTPTTKTPVLPFHPGGLTQPGAEVRFTDFQLQLT